MSSGMVLRSGKIINQHVNDYSKPAKPVIEQVAEQVAEPTVKQVAEQVAEPTVEQVAEPVIENNIIAKQFSIDRNMLTEDVLFGIYDFQRYEDLGDYLKSIARIPFKDAINKMGIYDLVRIQLKIPTLNRLSTENKISLDEYVAFVLGIIKIYYCVITEHSMGTFELKSYINDQRMRDMFIKKMDETCPTSFVGENCKKSKYYFELKWFGDAIVAHFNSIKPF